MYVDYVLGYVHDTVDTTYTYTVVANRKLYCPYTCITSTPPKKKLWTSVWTLKAE